MAISAKENMFMALRHEIPEYIPNYRLEASQFIPSCIHERAPGDGTPPQALGGTGKDWFGVNWLFDPVSGGGMVDPDVPPVLDDINNWKEAVTFPNLDAIDWKNAREKDEKFINPDKFTIITLLNGPFERMHSLMGMVNAICALITDPEPTGEFLMAVADHKIRLIDKIIEYYPVDMIEIHDDWGHQHNTFMSPETWLELIAPAMKKITDHIKSKGKLIQVHSCGKVESLIPHMIDIGIDHWASCQTCNDLETIIAKYGDKMTLLGGMDTPELTDMSKTREELKALAEKRMNDVCRGCGLLVYGSRSYPVLVEIINELVEEKKDFFKDPNNRKLPALEG